MQLSSRTLMNIATVLVMPEEAWWLAAAGVARTIEMSADGARPAIVSTDHQAALFDASPFAPELPTGLAHSAADWSPVSPGKPRVFMRYAGGMVGYREICADIAVPRVMKRFTLSRLDAGKKLPPQIRRRNSLMPPITAIDKAIAPAAVEATLCFIVPQAEKPLFHSAAYTGGDPKIFFKVEDRTVKITDVRKIPVQPSIEREGFELVVSPTAVADLNNDDAVVDAYYPEIEALLKKRFGATRIVIFDATRRSDCGAGAANPDGRRGPAIRLHVDYTQKSGPQRLNGTVGIAEAERLRASAARVIQVNVWRPIKGPVRRAPLAVADASSIARHELVATDQVFPDRVGEIYHLAYGPGQRWYYASEMKREEVLLIAGWDSSDPDGSRCAPHGAFQPPNQDPMAPARESIEIRTFVIIE